MFGLVCSLQRERERERVCVCACVGVVCVHVWVCVFFCLQPAGCGYVTMFGLVWFAACREREIFVLFCFQPAGCGYVTVFGLQPAVCVYVHHTVPEFVVLLA